MQLLKELKKDYYKNEIPNVRKKINEFKKEIKGESFVETNEEKIARAKEHPIENIVDVNDSGYALCVNHNDSAPSMYCKGNFAHCFSCGWSGDTISVLMKKDEIQFLEAVDNLS